MLKSFGLAIKNARLAKDLSLRDLAGLTGLDHSYIGRLEKGESEPSRDTVIKLAKALTIPKDELMAIAGYIANEELAEKISEIIKNSNEDRAYDDKTNAKPLKEIDLLAEKVQFYWDGQRLSEEEMEDIRHDIQLGREVRRQYLEKQKKKK